MVSKFVVYGNTHRNIFAIAKHTPITCVRKYRVHLKNGK